MEINQAYKILEVSPDISNDELKKHLKKLTIKFHPDVYKEDPNKFKQINEAYQYIIDYRENPQKYQPRSPQGGWGNFVDLGDILFNSASDFFNHQPHKTKPISLEVKLSFAESVTGCQKSIEYTRNIKCDVCNGEGSRRIPNSCKECNGFGQKTNNQNGFIFQSRCEACKGKNIKQENCKKCSSVGVIEESRDGNIQIPPGIQSGHVLRLQSEGHYVGRTFMFDTFADVNVRVIVEPHPSMSIRGENVFSTLNITLLEALEGKDAVIETVYGDKKITISPKSRNADIIEIDGCGVNKAGKHIVMLDVKYPEDISKIVEVLNGNNGPV